MSTPGPLPIRRIVTGHDARDVAKVISDGPALNVRRSAHGSQSTLMWCTDEMPVDVAVGETFEDMGNRVLGRLRR